MKPALSLLQPLVSVLFCVASPTASGLIQRVASPVPSSGLRRIVPSSTPLASATVSTPPSFNDVSIVGPRMPINEDYPGLTRLHSNPDVYVIDQFLNGDACDDIIQRALAKDKGGGLERSPVAYAGWTDDFKDLVELAVKGPVAWLALIGAWVQERQAGESASQVNLVVHALQNFAILFVVVTAAIGAYTYSRAEGLKALRTSTSTTLDDVREATSGTRQFVEKAAMLFHVDDDDDAGEKEKSAMMQGEARLFECPTVIRYEQDQVLAPHYDANRSAETEDANRGGQTLATLIVYLNDVQEGGLTRFGKLRPASSDSSTSSTPGESKLTIRPKRGDALLFFPADAMGRFDERTEHEGCPAVDEKWIARIWRHKLRVPPPFGLAERALDEL